MERQRRTVIGAAAVVALVALSGCGGGSSSGAAVGTETSTHQIDEKSDGTTLAVHFGDTIVVTLHSTYWSFLPPTGNTMQPIGPPATGPGTSCSPVAGSGCGTVSMTYNVGRVGTGTLAAHRDSCGEALRCVGKSASWSVTVRSS
jgi:hypothetical protein